MWMNNILETIGNTPLIKLNKIAKNLPCTVLAKVEYFNPGNSIKDRMALKMLEVAEQEGKIKPGGTIIEGTSGNTGMGLALAACVKGYKCIFTTTDKQSKEKADILKAVGAEVIVCPTNVEPEDPRSYYSVSKRLATEVPNSWYVNQYDNLANRLAHYEQTGPEIWKQTEGKVTHLVVATGTGGTIVGTAKYEMQYIDVSTKVTDKDGAVMARKIAKDEGIFCGYSAGSCLQGVFQLKDQLKKDDVVVCIFHDHGSRYVGKIYNDEWMLERGFLDVKTFKDLIGGRGSQKTMSIGPHAKVSDAINLMNKYDIENNPAFDGEKKVSAIPENGLFNKILGNSDVKNALVNTVMEKPYPEVAFDTPVERLSTFINKENGAVLSKDESGNYHIVTKYDIIQSLSK